jgi:hypothetical protein
MREIAGHVIEIPDIIYLYTLLFTIISYTITFIICIIKTYFIFCDILVKQKSLFVQK